jgi:L-aspartate oxidase
MSDKHELAELAPRDVVAYEMHKQYQMEGNRVYLKLDHLDPQKIQRRFSNIYKELLRHNIDLTKDLVPVAPAAHYLVGGIKTGLYGETNINNLYAVGEVSSTGVHGANRLASNSLLECLVFAKRAVEHSLENKFFVKYEPVNYKKYFVDKTKEETYLSYKNKIAVLLSQNVGIIRNESDLNKTLTALNEIYSSFLFEENEYYSLRLMSLITVAQLIIKSALIRKESRGGHRREDYPQLNDQYLCEIIHRVNFDPQIIGLR